MAASPQYPSRRHPGLALPWLAGEAPNQIDDIALGDVRWAASPASHPPPAKDDPVMEWLDRGFNLFGGIGRDPRLHPLAA